jgi:hypothetical protein
MPFFNKETETVIDIPNEVEVVNVANLDVHPANPRVGNIDAIKRSIESNGWWGTLVAQKSTRHVLAGNHRLIAAKELGIEEVPVYWVDVDDQHALRILLADNRTSDLGDYDDGVLATLLHEFSADKELLLGMGYDYGYVEDLLRVVNGLQKEGTNPMDEWVDMPEFEQEDKMSAYKTVIHFATEKDADDFFTLIERTKQSNMWYPEHDGHTGADAEHHYVNVTDD